MAADMAKQIKTDEKQIPGQGKDVLTLSAATFGSSLGDFAVFCRDLHHSQSKGCQGQKPVWPNITLMNLKVLPSDAFSEMFILSWRICGLSNPQNLKMPEKQGTLRAPFYQAKKERTMRNSSRTLTHPHTHTLYMVELALMVAIIFVMAFTPLGYLRTPGLSITFLTVPVAVGAIILGPKGGAVCGLAFGLTSLMQSMGGGGFGTMLFGISPLATAFTCIVPRVLEGWLCGLVFQAMKKFSKNGSYFAAGLACPLLNTVLFMTALVVCFYHTDYIRGIAQALGVSNPVMFAVVFVGVQGLIEAAACTVIASVVSRTLAAALKMG